MHPNRLLFSCFLLYFLIPNIGIQISLCTDDHPSYSNCKSSFNCGDITGVGYPFWGDGRSSNCGHPAFKLHCSGNSTSIQIMSQWFRVKQIDLENKILKIARADFVEGLCPKLFKNTTIDFNLFSYTPSDENATLFYRCASIPIVSMAPNSFTCGTDGDDGLSAAYFFPATALLDIEKLGLCKLRVTVPILQETARAFIIQGLKNPGTNLGIGEALNEGFEVQWSIDMEGCRGCIKAGGYCGYDWSLNGFTCFCNNQSNGRSCSVSPASVISTISTATDHNTGEKINWKRKLKIGFSAAGAGILLTCLGFFISHRYKRQQSASPALLSQDNSSSPSSKIKTDLEKGSTHFGVHIFTYKELEEATDNFHPSKELGDGGFGTVYHGKLRDGREVAVKRLYEHNFKRVEQFMNEVEILNHLWHQNLVTLYGCTSRHSHELLLVYEFIPNGTVADNLHGDRTQPGALKWPIRMNIAVQTASALAYLHASDVVHRDVKTNNILLDNNFHVKVADFGLSRLFPMDVTHISTAPQGTPGYLDPEYHQCYQLTEKSDVYSFGVVLVELISSKPAVDITRHQQEINLAKMAINKIQNCVLHEFVDPYLGFESDEIIRNKIKLVAELAFRCLQYEKELRPPMYEVFKILMRIERQDGKTEKVDSPKDDIGSLKNIPQMLSPDSLTDKWASRSTTPNGSS